eukprot:gene10108-8010_t
MQSHPVPGAFFTAPRPRSRAVRVYGGNSRSLDANLNLAPGNRDRKAAGKRMFQRVESAPMLVPESKHQSTLVLQFLGGMAAVIGAGVMLRRAWLM